MGDPTKSVIDQAEITRLARVHNVAESEVFAWANEDANFPNEYLRTHGVVNLGTYVELVAFYVARRAAGEGFALANANTSSALDGTNVIWDGQQASSAAIFRKPGV